MSGTKRKVSRISMVLGRPLLSPRGLLVRAVLIILVFLLCHAAGLREKTSILCGTSPTGDVDDMLSITLAALYMLAYFGALVVAPILLLASGVFTALQLFAPASTTPGRNP